MRNWCNWRPSHRPNQNPKRKPKQSDPSGIRQTPNQREEEPSEAIPGGFFLQLEISSSTPSTGQRFAQVLLVSAAAKNRCLASKSRVIVSIGIGCTRRHGTHDAE